jgi:predicted TIM-barrel fold metal-dependent hydrolase
MATANLVDRKALRGKIIDVHTHVGIALSSYLAGSYPYAQTAESLLYRMQANGVDCAVTFPMWDSIFFNRNQQRSEGRSPAPYVLENHHLCEEVYERTPEAENRILPFACVDPARYAIRQVRELTLLADEYPIYGIKVSGVMTQSSHRHLLGKSGAVLALARERNWPLLLHSTAYKGDRYCHNSINLEIARKYPELRFCLAHCLGFDKVSLDEADALPNVWVDSAGMKIQVEPEEILAPPERRFPADLRDYRRVFRQLVQAYPKTMIWGSDSPAYTYITHRRYADGSQVEFRLQGSYEQERAALDALDAKQQQTVANRNTCRFLFG